jgi:hypothetical protein
MTQTAVHQSKRQPVPLNGVDTPNLRQIVEQSRARSAVFDVLTNGVPGDLDVTVR